MQSTGTFSRYQKSAERNSSERAATIQRQLPTVKHRRQRCWNMASSALARAYEENKNPTHLTFQPSLRVNWTTSCQMPEEGDVSSPGGRLERRTNGEHGRNRRETAPSPAKKRLGRQPRRRRNEDFIYPPTRTRPSSYNTSHSCAEQEAIVLTTQLYINSINSMIKIIQAN